MSIKIKKLLQKARKIKKREPGKYKDDIVIGPIPVGKYKEPLYIKKGVDLYDRMDQR